MTKKDFIYGPWGITKKQLRALPSDARPEFNSDHRYSSTASIHEIDGHEILRVEVWENTGRKLTKFYDSGCRRDVTLLYGEKWSEGSLYYQLGYYHLPRMLYVPASAATVIGDYFHDHDSAPAYLLELHDEQNRSSRYRARIDHRLSLCERIASERKPIPAGFRDWCHNQLYGKMHYLLYARSGGEIKGTCTHCGHYVTLAAQRGMKHGEKVRCPSCRRMVKLVSPGKYKRPEINEAMYVTLCNRIDEGLLLRCIEVRRSIDLTTAAVSMDGWEDAMYLVSPSGNDIDLEYYYHRKLDRYCWDYALPESMSHTAFYRAGAIYTANLKRELKGTGWEHSAVELLNKTGCYSGWGIAKYLRKAKDHPLVERLMRVGLYNLAVGATAYRSNGGERQKKLHQVLGVSKEDVRLFAKLNIAEEEYEMFLALKNSGVADPGKIIEHMRKERVGMRRVGVESLLMEISPKAFERLFWEYAPQQVKLPGGYNTIGAVFVDYQDYLRQVTLLQLNKDDTSVMWPADLWARHNQLSKRIISNKDKVIDKAIRHRYKTERKMYEYSDGEYCVLFPQSHADMIAEGKCMSNCVATYARRVAESKTTVVFVRKISDKTRSFCTAEIDPDYETRQLRAEFNHAPDAATEKFWEEYEKNILEPLKNSKTQRKAG